jgi:ATP-dependent Clp protease, protease subunit
VGKRVNRDDIDKFHDYNLYIPTRTIYMGSESVDDSGESGCDSAMAERFVKNIHILDAISNEPITVIMNNIGGDEYHGFAMYDAIKLCKSKVIVKVMGHAMSMGSIILQAADERLMAPTSRQMIHYGTWAFEGHARTAHKWSEEGKKIDRWMESMYLKKIQEKHPEYTVETLRALLDHDTFLTAQESVRLGLADKVVGE